MIQTTRINECFSGLVGWRESAKAGSCYESLSEALKESTSGLYVNDPGSGMDLQTVNQNLPHDYDDVNTYLTDLYSSSVQEMLNEWIVIQKREVYTKALLANNDLGVQMANDKRKIETKFNRFVGFKITPKGSNSIRAEIVQLGGMFNTAQENLKIYFYSSRQDEPLAIFYTDYTTVKSQQWFTLSTLASGSGSSSTASDPIEIICDFINREKGHGQDYFIGYYESELSGQAIQTSMQCGPCNGNTNESEQYVSIVPICVAEENTYETRELFDIDAVGVTGSTFGLFMKINAKCDISECVCDNVKMFARSLKLTLLKNLYWGFYNSNEVNNLTTTKKSDYRLMAEKCQLELMGYVPEGSNRRIPGTLEQLSLDFSNVDKYCMGMRKRSLGTGSMI